MKRITRRRFLGRSLAAGLTGAALIGLPARSAESALKVRLGTLAPKDSTFHKILQEMGEKWRKATGGHLSMTIYTDGTMGGEADMVRRMRVGQLQAAMLTVNGLMRIEDTVSGLQNIPMMFRVLEEYDYVREHMRDLLEKKFIERGFVVVCWGDAGWVHFFSKTLAKRPEDFKRLKMYVGVGDTRTSDIMKTAGFNPISLEPTDILTGLQTGLIEAVPTPPVYALAGQFYGPASYMLDINWVPLVGGVVLTRKTWDAFPANARVACQNAANEAGKQIMERSRAEARESVEAMKKRGLKVAAMTPELEMEWRKLAEEISPLIREKIVPPAIYDEVVRLLKEYRAKKLQS